MSVTDSNMSLSKLWEVVEEREAWQAAVHGAAKSGTRLPDRTIVPRDLSAAAASAHGSLLV